MKKPKQWKDKLREEDERLKELREQQDFEKSDTLAMIIAALIVIMPVILGILAAFVFFIWLIFLR